METIAVNQIGATVCNEYPKLLKTLLPDASSTMSAKPATMATLVDVKNMTGRQAGFLKIDFKNCHSVYAPIATDVIPHTPSKTGEKVTSRNQKFHR